jgi:hypothetical protein
MNSLIFAMAMSCAAPIIENKTNLPWNENDQWNLDLAIPKCKELYPKSPCLKRFFKIGKQAYRAICAK